MKSSIVYVFIFFVLLGCGYSKNKDLVNDFFRIALVDSEMK